MEVQYIFENDFSKSAIESRIFFFVSFSADLVKVNENYKKEVLKPVC